MPDRAILFLTTLIFLAGCTGYSGMIAYSHTEDALVSQREYMLGPGDRLRILVYGEEDLSGEFVIDQSGNISLPLIGQVKAASLGVGALQQAVEARLQDRYLKKPQVSAEVMNYRPYYIMGEVDSPGEYPYSAGLTVSRAVAAAGGFTYRANTKTIKLKRAGMARAERLRFSASMPINPGDEIEISERLF